MRFRRSVKLAPGVKMNFSNSGVSWTLGPRGANVNIGKRGTFLNGSIPGTGFSDRSRLTGGTSVGRDAPSTAQRGEVRRTIKQTAVVEVQQDGSVTFKDESGSPLSAEWIARAKTQASDSIAQLLKTTSDKMNSDVNAIVDIHTTTPKPVSELHYECSVYVEPAPSAPVSLKPIWWLRWLRSHTESVGRRNEKMTRAHSRALTDWTARRDEFLASEQRRKRFVEEEVFESASAREQWLDEQLTSIAWPRETRVSYELAADGASAALDIDLPEIEDMPARTARPAERGLKLVFKPFGQRALESNYARHVHGLMLRVIGEMYASLPMLRMVSAAGYTQRANAATGRIEDVYVLWLNTTRDAWNKLNFDDLTLVDPISAFTLFDHKRDLSATNKLKPIQVPVSPSENK
jgi:Protein of unknown function (DUF4236)